MLHTLNASAGESDWLAAKTSRVKAGIASISAAENPFASNVRCATIAPTTTVIKVEQIKNTSRYVSSVFKYEAVVDSCTPPHEDVTPIQEYMQI